MKKFENLGKKLSKAKQTKINGGVQEWPCDTYRFSGSNGSGDSMTCDYIISDSAGNYTGYRCEVACMNGCNYEGCSFTQC